MSPTGYRNGRRSSRAAPYQLPAGPPGDHRLLVGDSPLGRATSLDDHLTRWGRIPHWEGPAFIDELDTSGLRGHGGAWFPVGTKWRSVGSTRLRTPLVVANGAEGEPASSKDRFLVHQLPHLVLDGAVLAASTLGASRAHVFVPADGARVMTAAIKERSRRALDPCPIDVIVAPDRFLAGQESAAVNAINGRDPAVPSFIGLTPVRERGVGGRPTLVQNVESLSHVALIARFGGAWFRSIGTPDSPGTALLTVTGRWPEPRIVEAPLGDPLGDVLHLGPAAAQSVQAVLLGGYGGGWVTVPEAVGMPLTETAARTLGSSIGAGVVALLPAGVCPLSEVARVVRYLEGQGAGQCGPCVNGLDLLATHMEILAFRPGRLRGGVSTIPEVCELVEGRGRVPAPGRRSPLRAHLASGIRQPHQPPPPAGTVPDHEPALPSRSEGRWSHMVTCVHYRMVVDPVACDGAGVCAELLPERIHLDPWGFPIIDTEAIPTARSRSCRAAPRPRARASPSHW